MVVHIEKENLKSHKKIMNKIFTLIGDEITKK